jgi:hypothetical protein
LKRLAIISAAAFALVIGLAGFAANTAEWVNVTAHVEKEISFACVEGGTGEAGWVATADEDCNYGVVFPEYATYERVAELTLSKSFFAQTRFSGVNFRVLWECKLIDENKLWGEDLDPGEPVVLNICRDEIAHTNADLCVTTTAPVGVYYHCGFPDSGPLDGNIRDFIEISVESDCLNPLDAGDEPLIDLVSPAQAALFDDAEIEELGEGGIDTGNIKCFYHLELTPPACLGHYNPGTDPGGADAPAIECHEVKPNTDPQSWNIFAELGDNFKIQVIGFSID